jgi:hypothetical protein
MNLPFGPWQRVAEIAGEANNVARAAAMTKARIISVPLPVSRQRRCYVTALERQTGNSPRFDRKIAYNHPKAMIRFLRDWERRLRSSYDEVVALLRP